MDARTHSLRYSPYRVSEHPVIKDIFTAVWNGLPVWSDKRKKNLAALRYQTKQLVLNLYLAWKDDGKCLAISRDNNSFSSGRYAETFHKRDTFILVVDRLVSSGFVTQTKGFHSHDGGPSFTSRLFPTEKLVNLFVDHTDETTLPPDLFTIVAPRELLILRDSDGFPVQYSDTQFTDEQHLLIQQVNSLLNDTAISYPTQYNTISNTQTNYTDEIIHPFDMGKKATLHKVFNRSSWEFGGRWHGACWLALNKEERLKIRLNEENVIEADFSSMHLDILYAMVGLELTYDPYILFSDPETRPLGKKMSLIALNAASKDKAIGAYVNEVSDDPQLARLHLELGYTADELYEGFLLRNQPIAQFIGADMGIRLQNIDSKIADIVLEHFVERQIPCPPVHDSFLIQERHQDELVETMREAFKTVVGRYPRAIKISKPPTTETIAYLSRIDDDVEALEEAQTPSATQQYYRKLRAALRYSKLSASGQKAVVKKRLWQWYRKREQSPDGVAPNEVYEVVNLVGIERTYARQKATR
jgi:hypothetical protein